MTYNGVPTDSPRKIREALSKMTRKWADDGKVIEAGWTGMLAVIVPQGASEVQIKEMRKAYFSGAHHLFSSMMCLLGFGGEPGKEDFARIEKISLEIDEFLKGQIAEYDAMIQAKKDKAEELKEELKKLEETA